MDVFDKIKGLFMIYQHHIGNGAVDLLLAFGKAVRHGDDLHALFRRDDQLPVAFQPLPVRGDQYGFQRHEGTPSFGM